MRTITAVILTLVFTSSAMAWPFCSRNPDEANWACISPDYNPSAALTNSTPMTTDPLAPWQWAMRDVLEGVPYETLFSDMPRDVKVAVLDMYPGHSNHPDLINRYETGINLVELDANGDPTTDTNEPNPTVLEGLNDHGKCVAGIIAAEHDNGIGMAGVCERCKIIPVRVSVNTIAEGIRLAAEAGAEVIHIAGWEGTPPGATYPYQDYNDFVLYPELSPTTSYPVRWSLRDTTTMAHEIQLLQGIRQAMFNAIWEHNVIFSTVVGNQNGYGVQSIFASMPEAIATLATNLKGEVSPFNNNSYSATVLAPGGDRRHWPNATYTDYPSALGVIGYWDSSNNGDDILCTVGNNHYTPWSGGSFAGPHTAGAIGVIKSYLPDATNQDVRRILWNARQPIAENFHPLTASINGRLSLKRIKDEINLILAQ